MSPFLGFAVDKTGRWMSWVAASCLCMACECPQRDVLLMIILVGKKLGLFQSLSLLLPLSLSQTMSPPHLSIHLLRHARFICLHQLRASHCPHVLHRSVVFRLRCGALALGVPYSQASFARLSVSFSIADFVIFAFLIVIVSRFCQLRVDDGASKPRPQRCPTGCVVVDSRPSAAGS